MEFTKEEKAVLKACFDEPGCSSEGVALWAKLDKEAALRALNSLKDKKLVYCDSSVYEDGSDFWDTTEEGAKIAQTLE